MSPPSLSYSAIICAYTLQRWDRLVEAVQSMQTQSLPVREIVVCVDHNPDLLRRATELWAPVAGVEVIENHYPGRLGSARNSGLERVSGDVVVFLDDDAVVPPDWTERLDAIYSAEPVVQALGGGPQPIFEVPRPDWFPHEFGWVFGCAYRGLPTTRAPTGRLIGAGMTVRRAAVLAVGGFHSDDHDDMDLSHRVADRFGDESVVYDPALQVSHHVTAQRLTWSYFWRRCYTVNRGKVLAFHDLEQAGNQTADLAFVRHALLSAIPGYLASGSAAGVKRSAAVIAGIALAALGNLAGRVSLALGRTEPSRTVGLRREAAVQQIAA